ncbi:MAG: glycosyltransferase, partial [Planctomycetota bacterium]
MLPGLLANISSHVDEIIAVDGSPDGPSTDGTKEILQQADKVTYIADTYKTANGIGWDMARQRMDAINLATGDIYFFVSADMLFMRLEQLREAV